MSGDAVAEMIQRRAAQAGFMLSVVAPADVAFTENADRFCGFGRHGDTDRREVTAGQRRPVEGSSAR
jgi:hypothetical protein